MEISREELNRLTERIIGCAFTVSNTLGCGFLEKVYENALVIELTKNGLNAKQQVPIEVTYDGFNVGDYTTDILVEDKVILELEVVKELDDVHFAQCINYLKGINLNVSLLLNFAKTKLEIKRLIND